MAAFSCHTLIDCIIGRGFGVFALHCRHILQGEWYWM
jgi:hypothetical protein